MAFWRVRGQTIRDSGWASLLALALLLAWIGSRIGTSTASVALNAGQVQAFQGGEFQASDVVSVPGSNGVLFVDNGRPGEVFWMRLSETGTQLGAITPVPLGVKVLDPEGITSDGSTFYVVGSQSRGNGDGAGLVRFRFDSQGHTVDHVESIEGLGPFLRERVPELRTEKINIEALAWDPGGRRLLVGFREPVIDGHALVLPVKLLQPSGGFSRANLDIGRPIQLALGGAGLRSLEYDAHGGKFLAIAEPARGAEKDGFRLVEWSDVSTSDGLREIARLDGKLKPEGAERVTINAHTFTLVVYDASYYGVLSSGLKPPA
jgi:Protein of unknown function (DUF3616)